MPRYLGCDYVSQVLAKKRQLLCRLVLACPDHLDKIGKYCHKGNIETFCYKTPWKLYTGCDIDEDTLRSDYTYTLQGLTTAYSSERDEFLASLSSPSFLAADFEDLVKNVLPLPQEQLEMSTKSAILCSPELIPSQGDFNDTMCLAIDAEMASLSSLYDIERDYGFEKLCKLLNSDLANSFEPMLEASFLHLGCLGLPTVNDLSKRLQRMPVQDPFVDSSGVPYAHLSVFKNDLTFPFSQEATHYSPKRVILSSGGIGSSELMLSASDREGVCLEGDSDGSESGDQYQTHGAGMDGVDATDGVHQGDTLRGDVFAQSMLMEPWSPSLSLSPVIPNENLDAREFSYPDSIESDDAKAWKTWCLAENGRVLESFSPSSVGDVASQSDSKRLSFAAMNHKSLSDSVDSGCQHMYLESPTIPASEGASLRLLLQVDPPAGRGAREPGLGDGLAIEILEPMPTSPEMDITKMHVLTTLEHKELLMNVQSKETIFDDILAYLLPAPHCSPATRRPVTAVELIASLALVSEDIDSESEFALPWDPLHYGMKEMATAKDNLRSSTHFDYKRESEMDWKIGGKERDVALTHIDCAWEKLEESEEEGTEPYLSLFEDATGLSCRRIPLGPQPVSAHSSGPATAKQTRPGIVSNNVHSQFIGKAGVNTLTRSVPNATSGSFTEREPTLTYSNSKAAIAANSIPKNSSTKSKMECLGQESKEMSALDLFMFMRGSGSQEGRGRAAMCGEGSKPSSSQVKQGSEMDVGLSGTTQSNAASPGPRLAESSTAVKGSSGTHRSEDIVLTGVFLTAHNLLGHHGQMAVDKLNQFGLGLPANFAHVSGDTAKFYIRQQEKSLKSPIATTTTTTSVATSKSSTSDSGILESCYWAAVMTVLSCTAECLRQTSFARALSIFKALSEKYSHLLHDSLSTVCSRLGELHVSACERGLSHPKIERLLSLLVVWVSANARSSHGSDRDGGGGRGGAINRWGRMKSVVLISGDFTIVSSEILNVVSGVEGLFPCVFTLSPRHQGDMDYLQQADSRLQDHSCLLIPAHAYSQLFPWERVSLAVDFNPLCPRATDAWQQRGDQGEGPLCAGVGSLAAPSSLQCLGGLLQKHPHTELYTLNGVYGRGWVGGGSAVARGSSGGQTLSSVPYKLICSQEVTSNGKLLQLLESRFNIVILERDYDRISQTPQIGTPPPKLNHHPSVIYDERNAAIMVPISQLVTADGFKPLASRIVGLSLQFMQLWIILYNPDDASYMYSGHVPTNVAKIHSSVANFDAKRDHFAAKVVTASSLEEAAHYVRAIGESVHRDSETWSSEEWSSREWLTEELSAHERFLLHFPCLNAFSAQLMLTMCSLRELMTASTDALKQKCPILPDKCVKMFVGITHAALTRSSRISPAPSLLPETGTGHRPAPVMPRCSRLHQLPATIRAEGRESSFQPSHQFPPSTSERAVFAAASKGPLIPPPGFPPAAAVADVQPHRRVANSLTLEPTAQPVLSQHPSTASTSQSWRLPLDEAVNPMRLTRRGSLAIPVQTGSLARTCSSNAPNFDELAPDLSRQASPQSASRGRRTKSAYRYSDVVPFQMGRPASSSDENDAGSAVLEGRPFSEQLGSTSPLAEQNVMRSRFFSESGGSISHEGGLKGLLEFGRKRKANASSLDTGNMFFQQSHLPKPMQTSPGTKLSMLKNPEVPHQSANTFKVGGLQLDTTFPDFNSQTTPSFHDIEWGATKKDAGLSGKRTRQPVKCMELSDSMSDMSSKQLGTGGTLVSSELKGFPEKRVRAQLPISMSPGRDREREGTGKLFDLQSFQVHQAKKNRVGSPSPALSHLQNPLSAAARISANNTSVSEYRTEQIQFEKGIVTTPSEQPNTIRQSKWARWLDRDIEQ